MKTKDAVIIALLVTVITKECALKTKEEQLRRCCEQRKSDCCVYKRYIKCK